MNISACLDGWVCIPKFNKCYCIVQENSIWGKEYVTWPDANKACMAADPDGKATLTSVLSYEENDFIFRNLSGSTYGLWLGGNDRSVEGVWR